VEDIQDSHTSSDLHDFVDFHTKNFVKLNRFHQFKEMLGINILSDLQFHTETVDEQLNQLLVVNLESLALVQYLLDEDLKLNS